MQTFNRTVFMARQAAAGFLLALSTLATLADAHEFKLGNIVIGHPYTRATAPQQTSAGAYLGLDNQGKTDDRLVKVESDIAKTVEIHNMEMVGDIMKMREVDGIDLKAGSKLSMKPGGGYHIMLNGIGHELKAGDQFPLTLYFSRAGKIEVIVHVEADANSPVPMPEHAR